MIDEKHGLKKERRKHHIGCIGKETTIVRDARENHTSCTLNNGKQTSPDNWNLSTQYDDRRWSLD